MPDPTNTYTLSAEVFIRWANREIDQLHHSARPNGATTQEIAMTTLLYRAVEMNLKMAEITQGETQA